MSVSTLNTNASLEGKTITVNENADTITGVKTFSVTPVVNAGIKFPNVQVPSGDFNTLDDYEEYTWTPVLESAGGGAPTYTTQTASYIKIGRQVHFNGTIQLATFGTLAAGAVSIAGLPFTVGSYPGGLYVSYWASFTTPVIWVGGAVQPGTTKIDLTYAASAVVTASLMGKVDLSATAYLSFHGSYFSVD